MNTGQIREPASFGKRTEPHTIIVSRNGKTRQFTIKPVLFSVMMCTVFMFMVGYFGATAYLVFRDDLIGASFARQARMQHEYEDRIAALRAKLDRVTSRQLLDQQAIETRVQELMQRQATIGQRNNRMGDLLEKAKLRGLGNTVTKVPVPVGNPEKENPDNITTGSIQTSATTGPIQLADAFSLRGSVDVNGVSGELETFALNESPVNTFSTSYNVPELTTGFTEGLFGNVAKAIGIIDAGQRHEVDKLRIAASSRTIKIASVLKSVGVAVPSPVESDIGGPFVPIDYSVDFETHLHALETSLQNYDNISKIARKLPLGTPVTDAKISSRYGTRVDPFNGRTAMHGGIDFKAPRSSAVQSSGNGIVTKAGRLGGYGKIVEVRHANGYITRYAHLSRILVKTGDRVQAGQEVGKVGSTGRSTGPHLHYEIRKGGKTVNPAKFITAGYKMRGLI